jgi:hypothetical protein
MKSSAARLAFLVATPLVLAVVLWFHPKANGDTLYEALRDDVTAMLVEHITMLFFIPLTALAAFVLLNGLQTHHPPPIGPIGLICFAVAVVLFERTSARGASAHMVLHPR